MDPEAEQLLIESLGGGGARGGRLVGYRAWFFGLGVRIGARMRPTRTHEETAELELDPGAAAEVLTDVIRHHGRIVRSEIDPGGTRAMLRGVIRAGSVSGAPAVVDVVLDPRPGGGSRVRLRTAAKWGLIREHTAPKAARVVLERYGRATATPADDPFLTDPR
jgi:hypothetical protein